MTDRRKQLDDLRAWVAALEDERDALQQENTRLKAVLSLLKTVGSGGMYKVDHDALIDEALKK